MTFLDKWIVAPKKERHLDQLVDRSGVLPYYIRRKPFNGVLETEYGDTFTYQIKGAIQDKKIRKWIKTLIRHLDASLEIEFNQVKKASDARIQFLAVRHVSKPWGKETLGENIWNPNGGINSTGLSTVLVKQQKDPSSQMATITHELGHALGLKHPKQKPYSPEFSTATTIMSYNEAKHPNFKYKDFTLNDLKAMASIWELESEISSSLATRIPYPVVVNCDSPDFEADSSLTTMVPVNFSTEGDDYLLAGEPNFNIYGAGGDDTIIGSKGRDTLGGGPGNDVLDGGPGGDMLYGHEGKDVFVVSEGEGVDEIYYFEQGIDIVYVKHSGGKMSLMKKNNGFTITLDGMAIAKMIDIEYQFGMCQGQIVIVDDKFIL